MSKSPAIIASCQSSDSSAVVCVKISPDDYCRIAISTHKLVRCDEEATGLPGLKDLDSGERFFNDEIDFFRPTVLRTRHGLE
jgi:hypothetical protein